MDWQRDRNLHQIISALAALFMLTLLAFAHGAETATERRLSDFANDDGSLPDGKDTPRDDSTALRRALAAGPGTVRIGPGHYRLGGVTVPHDVAVVGSGINTVIRSSGPPRIFVQTGMHRWAIREMTLDGEAAGDWRLRQDSGKSGIFTEGCSGWEIAGVMLRNFDGAGLQLTRTNLQQAGFSNGGNLERVTAGGNFVGVRFDVRAEYIIASRLDCSRNVIGCVIHAGNVNLSASNFGSNRDGLLIQDKENGSHGSISNCLVNHNERYALLARNVTNGMAINNCCFFYGQIELEECSGVNITSGIIGCSATTKGKPVNRIAGNYVIPKGMKFEFAPGTLVRENFTKEGPWELNANPP
jgi:hypothetical protein